VLALLGALLLPVVGGYITGVFVQIFLFAIFAISVDLIWGYGDILSFGHAAFFGTGAYVMGIVTMTYEFSGVSYAGILLAVLASGLLALIIATPLFYRGIKDEYIAIITLAVAIIVDRLVSYLDITGGSNGLIGVPAIEVGIPMVAMIPVTGTAFYYFSLATLLVIIYLSLRLVSSPFGTALVAIRENTTKARALGYDIEKHKTIIFVVSGALAGFAGAMLVTYLKFATPSLTGFILSTQVLLWVIIGGRGTIIGAVIGTFVLRFLENMVSGAFLSSWTLIYGLILVIMILLVPGGLISLFDRIRNGSLD